MKLNYVPPLVIGLTFMMMACIFYLITYDDLPEYLQERIDKYWWIFFVILLPFLFLAAIDKTDKEWEIFLEEQKKIKEENDAIIKKYDSMPDLEPTK